MKIKSKHILYVLIFLIVILLSKICYDCYSFKEGMTGTNYSDTLRNKGESFYTIWHNTFWSGGSSPTTVEPISSWNIDNMKKYFHNGAAKPGEIIRVLVFNMKKSDVNMSEMNKNISTYLSDMSKYKNPLEKKSSELNSSLAQMEKNLSTLPSEVKKSMIAPIQTALSKLKDMLSTLETIEKTVDEYRSYMYDERVKEDPVYGAYEVVLAIDNKMEYSLNSVITKNDLELATSTRKPGSLIRIAEQAANQNNSEANFNKIMDYIEKSISIREKYDSIKVTPSTYTKNRLANFRNNLGESIQKYINIIFEKDPIYGAYLLCAQFVATKNVIKNANTNLPGISFTNDVMKTTFSESLNGSLIRKAEYGSRNPLVETTFNDVKQYIERAIAFKREIIDKDLVKPQDNNQLKYWNQLKSGIEKSIQVYVDIMKTQDPIYGRYILMNSWYPKSTTLLKDNNMKTIFSMTYNGSALKTARFTNSVEDWKQYYAKSIVVQQLLNSSSPVDGNTQRLLNELKTELQQSLTQANNIIEKDNKSQPKQKDDNIPETTQEDNSQKNNTSIENDKIVEIEETVSDNQQRYDSILNKLNILQTNYDTHVSDSDSRLNNLITNNNNMFQEYATKLDELQQTNTIALEQSEQIAKEAAAKAIETQKLSNQENNEAEKNQPIEVAEKTNIKESNTHTYNNACPSIEVSSDCEKCKPMDEEYIRNDKCRNMYCNVIDSKDTNAYIYSCSPVMLDAVNKVKSVCEGCPDKKVVSVPKTDEQKMFDHAQSERNHVIDYAWKEKNHYDMYDVKKAPSYGTGLFQDINLQNDSPFYVNPFKASYPGMIDN
jgi:hypothetical protein